MHAGKHYNTDITKPGGKRGYRIRDGGKSCERCVNNHDERPRSQTAEKDWEESSILGDGTRE